MKTLIQGKNITTEYSVKHNWKQIGHNDETYRTVYTAKPELVKETKVDSWETMYEVDGIVEFNQMTTRQEPYVFNYSIMGILSIGRISISEDEEVKVLDKIYRADLNAYVLHVDKILSEKELYKEDSERTLKCHAKAFNKMMIEPNEKLLAYCNLHKLNVEDTDVDELFKVVYPGETYHIVEGELIVDNMAIDTSDITKSGGYVGLLDARLKRSGFC